MACLFSPIHYISKSKWSTYFSSFFFFFTSQTWGCIHLCEGSVITITILQGDVLLALFPQLISGGAGMRTQGFGFWKLHCTPWHPRKPLSPSFLYPFWSFSNRPLPDFPPFSLPWTGTVSLVHLSIPGTSQGPGTLHSFIPPFKMISLHQALGIQDESQNNPRRG